MNAADVQTHVSKASVITDIITVTTKYNKIIIEVSLGIGGKTCCILQFPPTAGLLCFIVLGPLRLWQWKRTHCITAPWTLHSVTRLSDCTGNFLYSDVISKPIGLLDSVRRTSFCIFFSYISISVHCCHASYKTNEWTTEQRSNKKFQTMSEPVKAKCSISWECQLEMLDNQWLTVGQTAQTTGDRSEWSQVAWHSTAQRMRSSVIDTSCPMERNSLDIVFSAKVPQEVIDSDCVDGWQFQTDVFRVVLHQSIYFLHDQL